MTRGRLRSLAARTPIAPVVRRAQLRAQWRAALRLNATYDEWTRAVIRRVVAPDSNCIDVGAHTGGLLRDIVAAAPRGHHLAVEPLPELAAGLRADFPGVEVLEVALSDRSGRHEFVRVATAPAYSGLRLRPLPRPDERVERIEVVVQPLDDLVPADREIRFVKIDVEGGEVDAVRGGRETLARNRPYVAFEHGARAAAAYGSSSAELFDLLVGEVGLGISLLDDWLAGRPALRREQFIAEKHFFFLAHPER